MAFTAKQRILLVILPPFAALLIRLLGLTLRYRDIQADGAPLGYLLPGPVVYAFWHRSLLACADRFRKMDIAILISASFDGELIARTVEYLGFHPVRGSSSHGGSIGLRKMERAYRSGRRCAFTADGPRGPAMIAKPGVVQLATLVDSPVGTFYALPDRSWQLRSWDRFLIPKPFSTITFTWPRIVPADSRDALTTLQQALDESVLMAERDA